MGGRDATELNVRDSTHIFLYTKVETVFILFVAFCPCPTVSGAQASPTAITGGNRTVWSSGTVPRGKANGMTRTVN